MTDRAGDSLVYFGPGAALALTIPGRGGKIGDGIKKRPLASKKKKLDYPEVTNGSRLAAEIRKRANKLTREQREHHFKEAMAIIYGGDPASQTTRAGH